MAYNPYTVTLGAALSDPERFNMGISGTPDPAAAITALAATITTLKGAHKTAFEAALATLVADGASPTQAHVTAVNNAYTTMAADIAAVSTTAAAATISGDAMLLVNPATVLTRTKLKRIFDGLLQSVTSAGILTA